MKKLIYLIPMFIGLVACNQGEKTIETTGGLKIEILKEGSGEKPQVGDLVSVHYKGYLEDGKGFDSSVGREPLKFKVGMGQVIPGWDSAMLQLSKGAKAKLFIPSKMAYGAQGAGGVIPPNSNLIFEVELVDIKKIEKAVPFDTASAKVTTLKSGVKIFVLKEGTGSLPAEGDIVKANFSGYLANGKMFMSTADYGSAETFKIGDKRTPVGLDEALRLVKKGEKARIFLPWQLAFKEHGTADGSIPPKSDLYMDFEIVDVMPNDDPKPWSTKGITPIVLPSGVKIFTVKEGFGARPTSGQAVLVHYSGFLENGKLFDSSIPRGEPTEFGVDQVVPGFSEALKNMKPGQKARVFIPASLGYGDSGTPDGAVPPKSNLYFDIELITVK